MSGEGVAERREDWSSRVKEIKRSVWIAYGRAQAIRSEIEELLEHPTTHRMPNIALIADTNNGKTMLLESVFRRNNPKDDLNAEKAILTVVKIETPPSPSEGRLYTALLEALSAAQSPREPEDSKLRRIRIILTHLETKLLILDDFFNIGAGTPTQRRKFLNALRNLSNQLRISIVIAGTSETLNILSTDPSIANRFKPVFLPRWGVERMSEFANFVATYEKYLFLGKPCSILNEPDLRKLLILSEGLLGEAVGVLRLLAEHAVKSGTESIDGSMLSREYVKELGWVLPSERTKYRA